MNYTSGTTGRPRGIRRPLPGKTPEEAYLGGFLGIFGIKPYDDNVHLVCSPLYHTAVLQFAGASLHIGHRLVLMDKWTPEEMLRLIDAHACTHTHMVPTQFHRLLALPEPVRRSYDVSSMRHAIHGAAPCPDHVKRAMIDWWGNSVEEYYAASEGGGAFATAEDWLKKPGTVGKAWPISELAVFDDDGNRLPPGELGTVYMKMNTGGFAYHKDEAKTKKNRIGDFFTVGDLGCLDEDGYLFLRDRKIDMIISGGVNIYPAEIESALLAHPAVADAAVFGIPHDDWGEEVKAVVEAAPARSPARPSPPRSSTTVPGSSPDTNGPGASTSSPRCPATPTASCTSGGCATRTGRAARAPCDPTALPHVRTALPTTWGTIRWWKGWMALKYRRPHGPVEAHCRRTDALQPGACGDRTDRERGAEVQVLVVVPAQHFFRGHLQQAERPHPEAGFHPDVRRGHALLRLQAEGCHGLVAQGEELVHPLRSAGEHQPRELGRVGAMGRSTATASAWSQPPRSATAPSSTGSACLRTRVLVMTRPSLRPVWLRPCHLLDLTRRRAEDHQS